MNIRLREALLPIFLISVVAAFLLLAVVVRSYSGSPVIAGDIGNDSAVSSQWQFGFEIIDSESETASAEASMMPASLAGGNESVTSADVGILSLLAPIQIVATIIFVSSATIYLYQKLYVASPYRYK
jgi:hypothetical protein